MDNLGNPACPNYDRCYDILPIPSAEWNMVDSIESWADSSLAFILDTTNNLRSSLMFRPNFVHERAEYRWQIGQDPRIWESSHFVPPQGFFRDFTGALDVTLEIRQPNTNDCITESESFATFTKTVYFAERSGLEFPILGDYAGLYGDPQNNFSLEKVEISIVPKGPDNFIYGYRVRGLAFPIECSTIEQDGFSITGSSNNAVSTIKQQNRSCYNVIRPVYLLKLDPETYNTLTIDFWYDDPDSGERLYRQFVGQRTE